jgi:hypothetical protein
MMIGIGTPISQSKSPFPINELPLLTAAKSRLPSVVQRITLWESQGSAQLEINWILMPKQRSLIGDGPQPWRHNIFAQPTIT